MPPSSAPTRRWRSSPARTSGIAKGDLKSLKGKKIAASFGTINHLYVLAVLEKAGLAPTDVTLVNTPPPEMTVALLAKGIDAFSGWDPWPIVALKDVPGAVEVIRGGDVISYIGFNVGLRPWVQRNGETIEKFLAAVSEADKWMRANPKQAAQVATRWIPGLKLDVAEAAMEFNIQQADRRLSANNFRALWAAQDRLHRLGVIKETFDVNKHIEAKHIVNVMQKHPQLFSDLPAGAGRRDGRSGVHVQAVGASVEPSPQRGEGWVRGRAKRAWSGDGGTYSPPHPPAASQRAPPSPRWGEV